MLRKILLSATALAAIFPCAASAAWYQAQSKHFVVYADDKPENVKAYTKKLERFDKAIRLLHVAPEVPRGPSSRVTIFVVNSVSDIAKLYGKGGRGVAGFYDPRASGSVAFTPRDTGNGSSYGFTAQAILFHEYTHHWMLTTWADAAFPPWFTEGFAEFHGTAMIKPDGTVIFGAPPIYRLGTIDQVNLLPADRLLRPDPGKLDDASHDALYSRGWLLVDYLTFDATRRKQLADYIGAINAGKSVDEASTSLGKLNGIDGKMNAWGRQAKFPSFAIKVEDGDLGAIDVRPLTVAESAVMPALIASARGIDEDNQGAGPAIAALARRLAAPFPADPAAQNVLAEAEFYVKDYSAAEAAADRALAADPRSIHALLYKGMAQQAILVRDKISDPARWQAVRKWYLAANKIDTENPQPLVQFFDSFDAAGEAPGKNAQNALIYAYALAPYDPRLRLKAAKVLLAMDKEKLARTALAPVAYSIEDPKPAAIAQKVLKALDAGDRDGAIKAFDPPKDAKDKAGKKAA